MRKSLINDQRGVGHVVLILAVVVIAAIGFVGWRVTQKEDTKASTASSASDKAAVDACNKVYKDKDLCKFTGNYNTEKLAFKMEVTSTDEQGMKSQMTFEQDGKGNSSSVFNGSGGTFETRTVGNTSYMKDTTDGSWYKFSSGEQKPYQDDNPTSDIKIDTKVDQAAKDTFSYKKLGKEKCGSLNCFKYQMVDSTKPSATYFVWFDDKDYRLQHYYFKDDTGGADMVITYTAVKIVAPSPVKEFSAGVDPSAYQQALEQAQ